MSLFAKKTVDSVLGAFNTAITDLEAVRERELAEAARKEQEAAAALSAANEARLEAARAEAVTGRLRSLVSTDMSEILATSSSQKIAAVAG